MAAERLLAAFGAENHQSKFNRDKAFEGFDVLHLAVVPVLEPRAGSAG
jgi:hypothetical protein